MKKTENFYKRWTRKEINAIKTLLKEFPNETDKNLAEIVCKEFKRTKHSLTSIISRVKNDNYKKKRKKVAPVVTPEEVFIVLASQEKTGAIPVEEAVPVTEPNVPPQSGVIKIGGYKIHIYGQNITITPAG